MKKNFNFALVGAIALVGAANFTACSSSDEIVNNPDYNPETNTVKTTISINIDPNNSVANTRQGEGVVQANQTNIFRGMQDLKLFTSSSPIVSGTTFEACLELDAISDDQISNTQSSKIYANQEVKVGTTHFLFYGKAMGVTASATSAEKLANGYTTTTLAKTNTKPSEITFSASSIISKTASDWTGPTTSMATYLTSIAKASGTYDGTTHQWSSASNSQLRSLYDNFTSSTAIRGGSAHAVLKTIQELYNAVYPISDGDPVTSAISTAILTAIDNGDYVISSGEGTSKVFAWKNVDPTFPTNIGMLEGTAQYKWGGTTNGFVYLVEPILNASTANDLENYVYPNELYYLTNTPLKATSGAAVWPTTVGDWREELWSGWDTSVSASTKNIALENNIQYGTALLATQVRCATKSLEIGGQTKNVMYDNAKGNVPGATENNPIPYSDTAFPLSAVIVGGQPSEVGWDFLPTTSASFNKDVCDPNMSNTIYAKNTTSTVYSDPNYTMVFDNLKPGNGEQQNVNICLEFTNNTGSDFYGKDGLIMNGQKFYLVATLELPGTQADDDAKADLKFNEARTFFPDKTLRVFIQDFVTTAQISLTAGSASEPGGALGGATPTIPDLRTSEQSLGLSVDLKWKKGLTFNVDL